MNLLVVRPGAIGDVILTLPVVAALRRRHPGARITFAVRSDLHELLRACGYADETISSDDARWAPYHLNAAKFAERKTEPLPYDAAYVWMNDGADFAANLRRGGIARVRWNRARPVPGSRDINEHRPASVYFADLLQEDEGTEPMDATPRLALPEEPLSGARELLTSLNINLSRPILALIPGAGSDEKCVSPAVFAELAGHWISIAPRGAVLIIEGPREREQSRREISAVADMVDGSVHLLQPSLLELAAVLSHVQACVANDSGPAHIAAALPGVRTFVLFQAGEPQIWAPLDSQMIDLRREGADGLSRLRRILAEVAEFA